MLCAQWILASAGCSRLVAAERALLAAVIRSPYTERRAGGLHVIEVSCTAALPSGGLAHPVIVLVHGFVAFAWLFVCARWFGLYSPGAIGNCGGMNVVADMGWQRLRG